jgi:hypothetical protein
MTKKLQKMMKKPAKKKAKRKKRIAAKDRAKHRGITFSVGEKRAMEILYDMIKTQRHKVPVINLFMEDPAADFCINMYAEIASWDYHILVVFVEEITGKKPVHTEIASLLGSAKSIFHALFMDEDEATKEQLLRYDSKWKMWPGKIRLKPKRRSKTKMATKKASRKKVSGKRAARKTAAKKVAKSASKANGSARVSDESKVAKTRKTFDPARESFRLDVYGKINQKCNTVARITKAVGEDRSFIIKELRWLRNRDFLTIK